MSRKIIAGLLGLLLGCAATPTHANDGESRQDAARQAFVDAMASVAVTASTGAARDDATLRTYALYPYLQAARLRRQLELVTPAAAGTVDALLPVDQDVTAFLREHGSAPVTARLRDAWLTSLATRREWKTYLEHYDPGRDDSPALRCHSLAARVATDQTAGLADALAETWLTGKSLPDACDPALDWWRARGGPGVELTTRRARLALEAGDGALARYLARSLPAERAAPLLQWAALIERPSREIEALIADPARAVEDVALEDGWTRFARSDPERAAARLPALVTSRKLDVRGASPYALAVALALSWSRMPGALDFFAQVHPDDYDERAHEWHARAALWARDWKRAAAAIAGMPETLRSQARWRYWAARSAEQLGDFTQAREGYAQVIPTDNWYAALASARLDRKVVPNLQSLGLSERAVDRLAQLPALVRTRELLRCQMESEAAEEWRTALGELTLEQQRDAVGLASRWGWHHQAIASAARQRLFNDYELLYPRPYEHDVREASRRTGLPRDLIYAIIRQESLYRADAGSSAGALGLMQLLPSTARIVARRAQLPVPSRTQLLDPAVNIPLGASFLADLVQRFDGETALAAAAYNAGPNAARRWLPPEPLDLDVWAENIPFNETRAYVQRVAWHALVFEWLEARKPREVSDWLRSVKPPAATASRRD
jgi:soluble lytic murein transglycosylase